MPPPWLFGVASMPYGCFNGLIAVALPYLLRTRGLSIDRIAAISAAVQAPSICYFLWAPLVDVKFRRRTWVMLLAVASSLCSGAALAMGNGRIASLTLLLTIASIFNQPIASAIGGLIPAVTPARFRGRTGGWSQAGILGGGIAAGGITIWLSDRAPTAIVAGTAALLIAVPAFAVLAIVEPRIVRVRRLEHVKHMLRDTLQLLRRRDVRLAFIIFLSPIGAGALMNLFAAIGSDFRATRTFVIVAVTIAGALMPVGALIGGALCDRYDHRIMYAVGGFLAAASVLGTLAAPSIPATYLWGAATYALATGFAYATFMALALGLLDEGGAANGTQFTLFMAAVNLPVVYMVRLDGMMHAHFGVRGMLAFDGATNLIFGVALLAVSLYLVERKR